MGIIDLGGKRRKREIAIEEGRRFYEEKEDMAVNETQYGVRCDKNVQAG